MRTAFGRPLFNLNIYLAHEATLLSRYRRRLLRRDVDLDNLRFMNEPVRFIDH